MKFAANFLIPLLFLLAEALAQEGPQPLPLVTSDLVAWSSMQEPHEPERGQPQTQPTPDPAPETQPAANPTTSPGPAPQNQQSAGTSDRAGRSVQVLSGSIVKEADNFLLKVSRTTSYKLDNPDQAQQFEGRQVRVIGTLDPDQSLIHVDKIEPLS